jgi:hypothetical protein
MLSTVKRSVFTVLLPVGLAILLCTPAAHAQRRGTLQRQQSGGFSQGRCQSGQSGSQSQLSTNYLQPQLYNQSYLQPQLYNQGYNLGQLYANQALLQQQYALQQYVMEAQLTGTDPNEALQSALLAMQLNQQNRLRAAQMQNR